MSEINSIAQGTYVIGQTSATTYQAGPGISITQPSEGTVRISNDETVLWSGSGTHFPDKVTTNEPLSSFERFRCEGYCPYGGPTPFTIETTYSANTYFTLATSQMGDSLVRLFYTSAQMQPDGIQLCSAMQAGIWTNTTGDGATIGKWYGDVRSHWLTKIVGINRKEV
jgi:hypothetical protein